MALREQEKRHLSNRLHWFFDSPGLRISEGILRYRLLILSVIGLLIVGSIYQVFRLRVDFSFEAIILTDDEEATFFEEFKDRFEEAGRDIVVLIQGESLLDAEGVPLIRELTEALEEVDGVDRFSPS